ncbi:alpha/beta fold hydrolase [Kribbella monticola]|uniref:alpha/beta fold hydrolase n=1 Tax=Kribbella monticola TaxID=2185285 RepID=UPI000DD4EA4D|nr:alpha/beta hydrolase [Kribbella monticola]
MSSVRHRWLELDGMRIFYREAGDPEAPVLLLPHGYPSSSLQFRNLLPRLAREWRLIAPDHPGFGYSDTPSVESFGYTFDAYAAYLERFVDQLELSRYVVYLHDYGSQFGLRLAMSAPERVAGLVFQNGDIYEDQHGPKYQPLKEMWADPTEERIQAVAAAVSEEGFRGEFVGELPDELVDRVSPDLWTHSWALVERYGRRDALVRLLRDQPSTLDWFEREQEYLRREQPPALVVWGINDGYMPAGAATAYRRDLPTAEIHLLDGGHWLLETHLEQVAGLVDEFLAKVYGQNGRSAPGS